MAGWNPWHGCHKFSEGCRHCYVYRMDARHGRDSSIVRKTGEFDLPLRHKRDGSYRIPSGEIVYTCFTSDFFVEDADSWRKDAWKMMASRPDLHFFMITKRIHRLYECIPDDWGEGYDNVAIACTVENQAMADRRLPIYLEAPVKYKSLACEPLLGPIELGRYLSSGKIDRIVCGGESGIGVRECHYEWILDLRRQCIENNVDFVFKQTGARFVKNGRLFEVPRREQHRQAKKAGIDVITRPIRFECEPEEDEQTVMDRWEE